MDSLAEILAKLPHLALSLLPGNPSNRIGGAAGTVLDSSSSAGETFAAAATETDGANLEADTAALLEFSVVRTIVRFKSASKCRGSSTMSLPV